MKVVVQKQKTPLKGIIEIPSDKSISHRAAIIASLTKQKINIHNFSKGADCRTTLGVIQNLGCLINVKSEKNIVIDATQALRAPQITLDCANSGTTMRLMAGVLAGQNFNSKLIGDESLSKRPMKRIIEPLTNMGAHIIHNNFKAPLIIEGRRLSAIDYKSFISSAQIKSSILLAGLFADGITSIEEPFKSRNHTELMLEYLGADIKVEKNKVSIQKSVFEPKDIYIPGDISSAAFFIVAALIIPDSVIILKNVGMNPTRTGLIDVLKQMGADIEILSLKFSCNEAVADIKVKYSDLQAVAIDSSIIPRLIDEIPILAVAATQAKGTTVIKGAEDLRHKESDRIKAMTIELRKMGADIQETEDGFIINGKTELEGNAEINCYHDHRIAMSTYIAGMTCSSSIVINEFDWIGISFPEFEQLMSELI